MALKFDSKAVPTKYDGISKNMNESWTESLLVEALGRMEFGKSETILDFGCGSGNLTSKYLAPLAEKFGSKVFAVDTSMDQIDYAQENNNHANVYYVAGDITSNRFPLTGVRFNKIICNMVLESVGNYGTLIADLVKFLKPNGVLWVLTTADKRMFRCVNNLKAQSKFSDYLDEVVLPDWVREDGSAELHYGRAFENENINVQEIALHERTLTFQEYRDLIETLICSNPGFSKMPLNLLEELDDLIRLEFEKLKGDSAGSIFQLLTFIIRN